MYVWSKEQAKVKFSLGNKKGKSNQPSQETTVIQSIFSFNGRSISLD